ncbi:MAG: sugar ABC transporter permease [Anaerolineae bacterium]|nr:sugar ABC transporter permease [Anaerolineae bacterium]
MATLSRPVADAPPMPSNRRNLLQRIWDAKFVYLILVPTFVLLVIFAYYPFVNALYRSLYDWNGVNVSNYVGMENFATLLSLKFATVDPKTDEVTGEPLRDEAGNLVYEDIRRVMRNNEEEFEDFKAYTSIQIGDRQYHLVAKDPVFIRSMGNMLVFVVADVAKAILIPILLAVMLYHLWSHRWRYIFRIMLILPAVVPGVVYILLWRDFFKMPSGNQQAGLVNQLLGLIDPNLMHTWLGDVNTVIPALIFTGFPWVNGANTLILLAGLLSIPGELYDAVRMDGAGAWTTFRRLELPMLRGPIRLVLVFALIGAVQGYTGILIMTNGGPANASMVPGLWLYQNAFQFNRYGYASAIGVILFIILITFTVASQRMLRSEVEYEG